MWSFTSNAIIFGSMGSRNESSKLSHTEQESEDEGVFSCTNKKEGLECPICWESFNMVENIPYVLWCGHTLCKTCVLRLEWAVLNFPTLPVQLPLFISCPWCHLLSFRLVYKGTLKSPRKNFFLLWMVESMNGERSKSCSSYSVHEHSDQPTNGGLAIARLGNDSQQMLRDYSDNSLYRLSSSTSYWNADRICSSIRKSLIFFVHLTAKFPLVIIFLLVVVYAIPASAIILALYLLVTILLGLPSILILYFAYPSLDWLFREIIN